MGRHGLFTTVLAVFVGACGGDDGSADDGASTGDTSGSTAPGSDGAATTAAGSETGGATAGTSATSATATGSATTGPDDDSSSEGDSTGSTGETPDDYCARVLFSEPFDDTDFESRDWYDAPSATLSTDEHIDGSASSFECRFTPGATGCEGGTPARHLFDEQTAVCLSYWIKYSPNWEGSGHPYHPHEFHFVTNEDDIYVGPSNTRLTTYTEDIAGTPRLAIQDSLNVDPACILLNNDSFVGCNGDFDTYAFTEERSAAACNGLLGDLDGRDCFDAGGYYYSARFWDSDVRAFGDAPPWDKTQWHHVVNYWSLNDIEDGVGTPNGKLRYWVDGELLVSSDEILLRTGSHPDMAFNQFLVAFYIGDGSPVDQTLWVDDLEVSAGI